MMATLKGRLMVNGAFTTNQELCKFYINTNYNSGEVSNFPCYKENIMFRKEAEKEGHSVLILDSLSLALLDEGYVIEIGELLLSDKQLLKKLRYNTRLNPLFLEGT